MCLKNISKNTLLRLNLNSREKHSVLLNQRTINAVDYKRGEMQKARLTKNRPDHRVHHRRLHIIEAGWSIILGGPAWKATFNVDKQMQAGHQST